MEQNKIQHYIINRLKFASFSDKEGVTRQMVANKVEKHIDSVTHWDFLKASYNLEEDASLSDIINCLLMEVTVISKSANATEARILTYFRDSLGQSDMSTLEKLFSEKQLDLDKIKKEL